MFSNLQHFCLTLFHFPFNIAILHFPANYTSVLYYIQPMVSAFSHNQQTNGNRSTAE